VECPAPKANKKSANDCYQKSQGRRFVPLSFKKEPLIYQERFPPSLVNPQQNQEREGVKLGKVTEEKEEKK